MSRRLLFFLPVAIFGVLAGYFLWGLTSGRDPSVLPSALLDRPAPQTELPPLRPGDESGLGPETLSGGEEITLVNFWASWCGPCRVEHPFLEKLGAEPGARLVGVNYRDDPAKALAFLAELGDPYARIGEDASGRAALDWGLTGVPETFIIDREGRIRYRHVGPIQERELDETIRPILESLER